MVMTAAVAVQHQEELVYLAVQAVLVQKVLQ
jgi:hypothetical protein